MAFKPQTIKQQKTSEIIAKQIMESIEKGELMPGDKLPSERELASQFGVSRTSLREALRALELTGVLKSKVGEGTFVSKSFPTNVYASLSETLKLIEQASTYELVEARKIIECNNAYLAAKRATEDDIKKLEDVINMMNYEIKQGEDGLNKDKEFHMAIAEATHNKVLIQIMARIASLMSERVWKFVRDKILIHPGKSEEYFKDHNEIFLAIKNKEPRKAHNLMKKHLSKVAKDVDIN